MTAELCAAHPDPDIWWADDLDEAWRICRRCPAFAGCERGQEIDLLEGNGFLLAEMPEPAAVEVEHGKRSTYTSGKCTSCPKCLAANARYRSAWLAKQGDVTEAERFEQTAIDWEVSA